HRRRVPGARGDPGTGRGSTGARVRAERAGARAEWAGPTATTRAGAGHPAVATATAPSTEHRGSRRAGPAAVHATQRCRSADDGAHLSRHVLFRRARAGPWVAD